jgi:hypothetical protein
LITSRLNLDADQFTHEHFGVDISSLTIHQASKVIDQLNAIQIQRRQKWPGIAPTPDGFTATDL